MEDKTNGFMQSLLITLIAIAVIIIAYIIISKNTGFSAISFIKNLFELGR